jgi:hypothetical protein
LRQDDGSLFPIPIRVKNVYLDGSRRQFINAPLLPDGSSEFHTRFTMMDTVVGVESGILKYIRIPTTIKIWLKPTSPGKILVPILDIEYQTILAASFQDSTTSAINVSFSSEYIHEFGAESTALLVVFVLFASFCLIYAVSRTRSWYLRNMKSADTIDIFVISHLISIYLE